MKYNYVKMAGALIFIGAVQFLIELIIAEARYPGYSVSKNYISDLGVGPSAAIFNSSVFLFGVMIVIGAYFIWREFDSKLFFIFAVLAGFGAIGVGLFTEHAGTIHTVFSLITFLFGGLTAIASYKLQRSPLSYFAVLLGIMTLVALALFISRTYLGLDKGGMERMIAYPVLLWAVGFSSYLIGQSEDMTTITKQ
jgi:hypothetical membrane protein